MFGQKEFTSYGVRLLIEHEKLSKFSKIPVLAHILREIQLRYKERNKRTNTTIEDALKKDWEYILSNNYMPS